MADLEKLIDAELKRWNNPYPLEKIFRTAEPKAIVDLINAFCEHEFGSTIAGTSFYEVSVGVVFGLQLHNDRRIVIKALASASTTDYLRATVCVQHYLRGQGYPCTNPLCGPLPLVTGIAMVEAMDDEGEFHDAHEPRWRRSLAELLAWQIKLLSRPEQIPGIDLHLFDKRLPLNILWGEPHSNIFDFEATAAGAEWIDELAWQAKDLLENGAGEFVLGHGNWSTKHVRYIGEKAHIVYDWDSLKLEKEPALVGGAAMTFTYIPSMEGVAYWPTRAEAQAFIEEYEIARGAAFTDAERKTLAAAMTMYLAYGARCEHSLAPHEREYPEGSRRAALAQYRDLF